MIKKRIISILLTCTLLISLFTSTSYAASTYRVVQSGSNYYYSNLFDAINKADNVNGSSVYQGSTIVFQRNDSNPEYWVFQRTDGYGSYSSKSSAINWAKQYNYSRVIYSNGDIVWNYYKLYKSTAFSESITEPNAGGYFHVNSFNYTYVNGTSYGYNKASTTIALSDIQFKPSSSITIVPYMYFAAKNKYGTFESGIYYNSYRKKWCLYKKPISSNTITYVADVCGTVSNGGVISGNQDIDFSFEVIDNGVKVSVNGSTYTFTESGKGLNAKGTNLSLLRMTSCVPNVSSGNTPDYRNGGYLKNIIWSNNKIYRNGVSYAWKYNSSATQFSMLYNTDLCSASVGSTDTINISYE